MTDSDRSKTEESTTPPETPEHHEEHVSVTEHTVTIGRRKVPYTATAGRLVLKDEKGAKKASFFSTSYIRSDVDDQSTRPIIFAFNGGPGSASVWLHLGAFGPRRVELDTEGMAGPPPGQLVENGTSLLDVADLVFIDPVGTGFSRGIPKDDESGYFHFTKDIESVAEVIRLLIGRHGRWASPKYLAGESYGTTRAAGLAAHMLERDTVYFNGLILVSSILNFTTAGFDPSTFTFTPGNDLPYILFLPTYAATAHFHGVVGKKHRKRKLPEFLDEVRDFARTEYATALLQGDDLDPASALDIATRLSEYTGLGTEYLLRYRNRVEILRFCKELLRSQGHTVGRLDSRYTGRDRFVDGDSIENDPAGDEVGGLFGALLNDYVRRDLGYETDLPYVILSMDVNKKWNYEDFKGRSVDVSEALRSTMVRNTHMKVYVANGYYDLATPHFATEYTFSHMSLPPEAKDRVEMSYFDAGHMMYLKKSELVRLNDEIRAFVST